MSAAKWPPPEIPLVEGDYAVTGNWQIHLSKPFARRFDKGSLVLWRPGLTLWIAAWNNDDHQSQAVRLAQLRGWASPARFDTRESTSDGIARFSYRLREESAGRIVNSIYAWMIWGDEYMQLAVYYDDVSDAAVAQSLVDGVSHQVRS